MDTVFLVVHLILAVSLIGIILLQRSEGGLGGLGGAGGGGLMTARGTANFLTKTTTMLAAGFMITSICLALMASAGHNKPLSIGDQIAKEAPATPAAADTKTEKKESAPSAPLQK
jgi:preprotein translocase subunit SecG